MGPVKGTAAADGRYGCEIDSSGTETSLKRSKHRMTIWLRLRINKPNGPSGYAYAQNDINQSCETLVLICFLPV